MSAMKSIMMFCANKNLIGLRETVFGEPHIINPSFRNFGQLNLFQYIFGMNDEFTINRANNFIEKII